MSDMEKPKFNRMMIYAALVWFIFYIISFLLGFTSYPDLAYELLLGNTAPLVIAAFFGLWMGASGFGEFKLSEVMATVVVVAFLIGVANLMFTVCLINNSLTFLIYANTALISFNMVSQPILNQVISTWIGCIFVVVPAAGAAYLLLAKNSLLIRNRRK